MRSAVGRAATGDTRAGRARPVTFWGLVGAFAFVLAVLTAVTWLDRWWWVAEDAAAFRLEYLLASVAVALAFAIGRRWKQLPVGMLCVALNAVDVVPLWWGAESAAAAGPRLRLVSLNVHTENTQRLRSLRFLQGARADVIVLLEIDDDWVAALTPLLRTHPYHLVEPRPDNFGIGVFSRRPLEGERVVRFAHSVPSIVARLPVEGLTLVAAHPVPPIDGVNVRERNDQMDAIAGYVAHHPGPTAVLGDFNMTAWSPQLRRVLDRSRLRDSARGFGWQPTWPAGAAPLWTPIDQVLLSPGVRVIARRIGPDVGSDHYPVIIDVRLPRPTASVVPRRTARP